MALQCQVSSMHSLTFRVLVMLP